MTLSWSEMETQEILDAYVRANRPLFLSATDIIVAGSVDYDLSRAEGALRIFEKRHEKDVCEVGRNPLTVKIFNTFYGRAER